MTIPYMNLTRVEKTKLSVSINLLLVSVVNGVTLNKPLGVIWYSAAHDTDPTGLYNGVKCK